MKLNKVFMTVKKIWTLLLVFFALWLFCSTFVFSQTPPDPGSETERAGPADNTTADLPGESNEDPGELFPGDDVQVISSDVLDVLPQPLREFVSIRIFGYPLWRIVLTCLVIILGFLVDKIIHLLIQKYSKKLNTFTLESEKVHFFSSTVHAMLRPARLLVWAGIIRLVGFIIVQQHAGIVVWVSNFLINLTIVIFIYDFVEVLEKFLLGVVNKTETKVDDMLIPIVKNGLRVIVVIIAIVQIYQSVSGQDITSILAGLGLAGMAVALAAQDTIKNLFGFLMIALDQPFKVGERINFNDHDGLVEAIGLRSTKLRRLDGHIVTIPNMKAADEVIQNIGRRENIRRIMNIGITYDTPPDKVLEAVAIVKEILKDHEGMQDPLLPQVFFNELNADSLNIFAIYWYHPPAYWDYMKHCEWVNMELLRRFNDAGIDFAFPTQTVHVELDSQHLQLITQLEKQAGGK